MADDRHWDGTDGFVVAVDERTESCLRALQASAVENVLTQTVAVLDRDSLYRSSGLIVQCGQSAYSIGADSLVSEQLDELFFVCASVHVQWPHRLVRRAIVSALRASSGPHLRSPSCGGQRPLLQLMAPNFVVMLTRGCC